MSLSQMSAALSPMPVISSVTSGGVLTDRKVGYSAPLTPPVSVSTPPLHHQTNINPTSMASSYYEHIKYSN